MSYKEFLKNIDNYVGKIIELTIRRKQDGYINKTQRYVWSNKEFGELKADSLIEVLGVEVIRNGKLDRSVKDIIGVR